MIEARILVAAIVTGTLAATFFVSVLADALVKILPPGRPLAVVHIIGYALSGLVAVVAFKSYKSRMPRQ